MSSNKYYCCELSCDPNSVFLDGTLTNNAKTLNLRIFNEQTKNISYFPVIAESHEKSILSYNLSSCKKIMFVMVECYNVPITKYVEYVFKNGNLVTNETVSENETVPENKNTPQSSIMARQGWCGTCG